MTYDPAIHHRRSIRLRGHDYSGGGAYFVTVCIQDKALLFGQVVENEMVLSEAGRILERIWLALPSRFPSVVLDVHQVMPNHFHGIIVIPGPGLEPSLANATGVPVIQPVGPGLPTSPGQVVPARPAHAGPPKAKASLGPTSGRFAPANTGAEVGRAERRKGLGAVVGAFKSLSAIAVNRALARSGRRLWQEDYYEHIIRDVAELEKIRDYIIHNPARWLEDPENPDVGPGLAPA